MAFFNLGALRASLAKKRRYDVCKLVAYNRLKAQVSFSNQFCAITEDSKENATGDGTNGTDDANGTNNAHTYKQANDRRIKLVDIIRTNTKVSVFELAKLTGMSRRTISRDINILKSQGKLQRVGSNKNGYWIIA